MFKNKDLSIRKKGIIIVLTPLVLGLIMLACMLYLLWQAELETQRETKERTIRSLMGDCLSNGMEASSAASYYEFTKDKQYLRRYSELKKQCDKLYEELKVLVKDQPDVMQAMLDLRASQMNLFTTMDILTSETGKEQVDDYMSNKLHMMVNLHGVFRKLTQQIQRMQDLEESHLSEHSVDRSLWHNRLKDFFILAGAVNLAAGAALAVFAGKTITDRLRYLETNAERLSTEKPLLPPLSGNDEIAVLDRAFHSMARALAETSRRERALIENALDVICSIDSQRKFVEVNPACEKVWGYKADELIGKSIDSITVEEDRLITLDCEPGMVAPLSFENRVLHKDGSIQYMLWSVRWSVSQNVFVCIAHSITDRKAAEQLLRESEAKLHTVMESMPVILFIIDENGTIKAANKTSESLLGYEYVQLFGANLKQILKLDIANNDFSKWIETALGSPLEISTRKSNGEALQLEVSTTEIFFGQQRNFLVVALDVNERHAMDLLKQEFISMLSNDLKEPIARVQEVVSRLKTGDATELNEKGSKYLEKSEMETRRLVELIDDLLDAERLRSGTMALEIRNVSLRSMIERAITSVALLAEKSEISLTNHCEDRQMNCDSNRIVQVLINMLSNAIKYSPKNGEIRIVSDVENGFVRIGVADQGRGIPLAHRQAIFEEFVQVEDSDSRVKGGIGLGLAICREIAKKHGGRITVDSEEGQGATFWLCLPV